MSETMIIVILFLVAVGAFLSGWLVGEMRAARNWENTFRKAWDKGYSAGKEHGIRFADMYRTDAAQSPSPTGYHGAPGPFSVAQHGADER